MRFMDNDVWVYDAGVPIDYFTGFQSIYDFLNNVNNNEWYDICDTRMVKQDFLDRFMKLLIFSCCYCNIINDFRMMPYVTVFHTKDTIDNFVEPVICIIIKTDSDGITRIFSEQPIAGMEDRLEKRVSVSPYNSPF